MPGGRGWPTGTTSLTTRSTQDRTGEVEQPRGRDLGNCPCSAPSVRCTWGIALVHRPLRPPPPLPPGAEGEGRRDNRERSLVHCAPGGAEKARILPKMPPSHSVPERGKLWPRSQFGFLRPEKGAVKTPLRRRISSHFGSRSDKQNHRFCLRNASSGCSPKTFPQNISPKTIGAARGGKIHAREANFVEMLPFSGSAKPSVLP